MYEKAERRLQMAMLWLAVLLCLLRFAFLHADFPNHSPWMVDQAKFTDEGWWSSGAVRHLLLGHWQVAGDYNPAIVVPVWSVLLAVVFHFTGVSIEAARAVSVVFSLATVGLVYLLVEQYADKTAASLAALLLAASPFAAVFSRLVTLDTVTVFEFCLLLWVASRSKPGRVWPLLALGLLTAVLLLTKTTAAALLPALFGFLWFANAKATKQVVLQVLTASFVAAAAVGAHLTIVLRSRFAADYHSFFDINAMPDVQWRLTGSYLMLLFRHGLWVDRVLYPAAMVALLLSLVLFRQLWKNPLFVAAFLALAGDAIYILRRQDDYAPRYFLAMLVPVILIVVLTGRALSIRDRTAGLVWSCILAIAMLLNVLQLAGFFAHRQYQYYEAAQAIRAIVDRDNQAHRLLLGASGDELSLMTGIPAINDGYSSEELSEKVSFYQPGWYVGWNDLDQDILDSLSAFRLDRVAAFPVFDRDERNLLILYRMVPITPSH